MARFLIVHGLGNHRPAAHWQCWLADQLRAAGRDVRYPQLPRPDAPHLARWLEVLAEEYSRLGAGERVVVCHSLGCALWHAAWSRGTLTRPADRVLFVAPPGPSVLDEAVTAEFGHLDNAAALLASCRVPLRLVASDRDPYCVEGPAAELYGKPLGLDSETLVGAAHLTPASGFGPWPRVLAWCLDGRVRFSDAAAQ
jgi:predicted alpha/beta hydrolase family esterase